MSISIKTLDAANIATPATLSKANWAYIETASTRDLRLDLLRGMVIPLLFVSHFDFFSAYMYIGWERIGVVATAEFFVLLSGIVVGMLYGRKIKQNGLMGSMPKLMDRALELYRTSVVIIIGIGLLRYIPYLDSSSITTFYEPWSGKSFPLYPDIKASFINIISQALLLRIGPHQFQIIGMYVSMFVIFTPLAFFLLQHQRWQLLMAFSWALYIINSGSGGVLRPLQMQYEWAFPTLAWQLVYIHGLMIGYYRQQILAFFQTNWGIRLVYLSGALCLGFIFFSWNNPIEQFASWARFNVIPPDTFHAIYNGYFSKNTLGIGRLMNVVVLFITLYALLTRFWYPINKALGWYLIPLGQASLYVFIVHLFLILAVKNTPLLAYNDFWINTALHTALLALIWIMVKKEFLFRWIPR